MKRIDFNCFCGNWPFFRVRCNTMQKLMQRHKECGIDGGYISALESIFYQDPYEAELQLAQQLRGTAYHHAMLLNPMLPGWCEDLARCIEKLDIKAVRIVPGFHGYTLSDPIMEEVVCMLRKYRLPLLITLRMRDERMMWMLNPEQVSMDALSAFLQKNPDIPIVLNHIRICELDALKDLDWTNLYVDISGFKDGPVEAVLERPYLLGHVLYGSGAPLLEMRATTYMIEASRLKKEQKAAIFSVEAFFK